MSINSQDLTSFQLVRRIASFCSGMNSSWYDELDENRSAEAIQGCRLRLNSLAPKVDRCCAVHFETVKLQGQIQQLTISHKNTPLVKGDVQPNDDGISDFYLVHEDHLYHIQLDPTAPNTLNFPPNQQSPRLWKLTTEKCTELSKTKWNQSFVTANYHWAKVVEIPMG